VRLVRVTCRRRVVSDRDPFWRSTDGDIAEIEEDAEYIVDLKKREQKNKKTSKVRPILRCAVGFVFTNLSRLNTREYFCSKTKF
jgi:hypothetical protein